MAKYNGHKDWNHWNISLWVNNDAGLYALAKRLIRQSINRDRAAMLMYEHLYAINVIQTPDGATYSKTAIRAAMVGM